MKPLFFLVLLIIIPQAVRSQVAPGPIPILVGGETVIDVGINDSPETVAWRLLKETKGVKSRKELRNQTIEDLKSTGDLPYRRVEIDGVRTTDDTSLSLPGMFDRQLKMSYHNEPKPTSLIAQGTAYVNRWFEDLSNAGWDMNGKLTKHAEQVLSPIQRKQVDEIIAHSWGTEAVYAAILSGDINPPKRLILVGIPEKNYAQWLFLAKYTGIEVHVLGFWTDKVQFSGDILNQSVTGLPRDGAKLEQLWKHRCAQRHDCADPNKFDTRKFDYNVEVAEPHGEALWPSSRPHDLPQEGQGSLDHDRMLYYQYLAKRGLLNKTIAQLDRFDVSQQKLIKEEENNTLSDAMTEAHAMIKIAREEFAKEAAAEAARRQEEQVKRQEEIRDAAAAKEARRQEEETSERRIRAALRGIASRACADMSRVSQSDLDAIPHVVESGFFERAFIAAGFENSGCAETVYIAMASDVERGRRMDIASLRVQVQESQPPAPARPAYVPQAAVAALRPAPAVAVNVGEEADKIKSLAVQACDDSMKNLDHQDLLEAVSQSRKGRVHDFDRVMNELSSGCEKEIYGRIAALIQERSVLDSGGWIDAINGFIDDYESARKRQDSVERAGPQRPVGPNRAPQPQRHCAAEKSGVCVYWTD